jgi:hypothetical protein
VIPRQKNAPKLSPLQWIEKEENISKGKIEKEAAKVWLFKIKRCHCIKIILYIISKIIGR